MQRPPSDSGYELIENPGGHPLKAWTRGVPFEDEARNQLMHAAALPIIHRWVAVMPDVHAGMGSAVGSVIPTLKAIIPAAVGVDIGCGMMAAKTSLRAGDLPDNLRPLRDAIERAVPHGRTNNGGPGDKGAWRRPPRQVMEMWLRLESGYKTIIEKHPGLNRGSSIEHLGTLGGGNHFIELCLDESGAVWIMLHSGSRGPGNRIGGHFIELAKADVKQWNVHIPGVNLAYLREGSRHFDEYVFAVQWAQEYARANRELMMSAIVSALRGLDQLPPFQAALEAVNCHHNYVAVERHHGEDVYVTRKGAVRAGPGDLGIIPGSMGERSFIVRGKGNPESFHSCSHGAGRVMSRTEARKRFTLADHIAATAGVECRRDKEVLDETPGAYKSIDAVMAAQDSLVEAVHTLKQVLCVKG
ncbi:MAG: RNA-splicing ligase RtcB [Myxococcota bacterium]|nr:RNA-splicing ligase RtcB [Myxococcota bacterium]